MMNLIPPQQAVMEILEKTGAYRYGHFVNTDGKHSSHYFKIPIAFHFYDNARVLGVGLSRHLRMEASVARFMPGIAVVSPSADGIPVAFSIRDALGTEQIFWATRENDDRKFPSYIEKLKVNPCIVVDDIVKSGSTLRKTFQLLKGLGTTVIGCGAIVKFADAPAEIDGVPIKSLVEFDSPIYDSLAEWEAAEGKGEPSVKVAEF